MVINRYFASSKICSSCGRVNPELTLNTRFWECGSCRTTHDRDVNAANCIVAEGVRILRTTRDSSIEDDQPHLGRESPGNGRQDARGDSAELIAPVAVLANEASTRKRASNCLDPAEAS